MPLEFLTLYPEGPNTAAGGGGGGSSAPEVNVDWPGLPPGATPDSRDATITAAGTTALWTPGVSERIVIVSAFISTDVAGRIAIVDDLDIQGRRIAVFYAPANGGAAPNLVPAPWNMSGLGVPVRVVVAGVGNVFVRVSGYTIPS